MNGQLTERGVMKNTTGLYKHQRDNQGKRRKLPAGDNKSKLVPVTKYEYEIARDRDAADIAAWAAALNDVADELSRANDEAEERIARIETECSRKATARLFNHLRNWGVVK